MMPNFALARQHIENARTTLDVDHPKAQKLREVLDLTIEALVIAEAQTRREESVVIRGLFRRPAS